MMALSARDKQDARRLLSEETPLKSLRFSHVTLQTNLTGKHRAAVEENAINGFRD
jgi:hypothetical protein